MTRVEATLAVVETMTAFRTKAPVNPLAGYDRTDLQHIIVAAVSLAESLAEQLATANGIPVDELLRFISEQAVTKGVN